MPDIINAQSVSSEEINAAEAAAADAKPGFSITLSAPLSYNGSDYSSLSFDFEKMTGRDTLAIEREMAARNSYVLVPWASGDYIVRFLARACDVKLGIDAFESMKIRDYNKLRARARAFLMAVEQ